MSEAVSNWEKLGDMGITMWVPTNGSTVFVENIDLERSLQIAQALTINLDELRRSGSAQYTLNNFSLERVHEIAQQRIAEREGHVFGETRPADANCAVRVDGVFSSYRLVASIRNHFSDKPELQGAKKLQATFVSTIESLNL